MDNQNKTKIKRKKPQPWIVIGGMLLLIAIVIVLLQVTKMSEPKTEVITASALKEIISVSELSTFTAVYNGIAEVENPKKEGKVDYYVSYEARVDAGIDFAEIAISVDDVNKTIIVDVPEVYVTDITVDIASLDFIFFNSKANTSTVTEQAFKACESDVERESEQQDVIYTLAKQNAVNVLTALIKPIIEQLDAEYTLIID